jgi:hypothetical protein
MTIRIASVSGQIRTNGLRLHRAMASRIASRGADQPPSKAEQALLEERRELKAERAARAARAQLPREKPKPAWMTRPPKAPKVAKVKAPKEAHAKEAHAKDARSATKKPSRAEKHIRKAESLEAAKKASKKSAKT